MKTVRFQIVTVYSAVLAFAGALSTASADPIEDLEACRSVSVEVERLACFDAAYDQLRAVGLLTEPALKSRAAELNAAAPAPAVAQTQSADTEQSADTDMQKADKGFGLPFFRRKEAEKAEDFGRSPRAVERDKNGRVDRIGATITAVRTNELGRATITLSNGQVWRTERTLRAKAGDVAEIHRGFAGGYIMSTNRQRNVRVTRIDDGSNTAALSDPIAASAASPSVAAPAKKKKGWLSRLRPSFGKKSETESSPAASSPSGDATPGDATTVSTTTSQKVTNVMVDPTNMFILTLENGQVWQQISGSITVHNDDIVVIEENGIGEYSLSVGGEGVRVPVKRVS